MGLWTSLQCKVIIRHRSWKNDCASAAPGSSMIYRTRTAPRCQPLCVLRGTALCPEPFRGNLSSARGIRWRWGSARGDPRLHLSLPPAPARIRCADRDTHHSHPSFVGNVNVYAFQERNLLHRRGVLFRWYIAPRCRRLLARAGGRHWLY